MSPGVHPRRYPSGNHSVSSSWNGRFTSSLAADPDQQRRPRPPEVVVVGALVRHDPVDGALPPAHFPELTVAPTPRPIPPPAVGSGGDPVMGESMPFGTLGAVLHLYDTARGAVVPFEPREPGKVSIYACGPTVYGPPHLGHGRNQVTYDVLRRYLDWAGNDVTFVSNITDIDDKIIERANREERPVAGDHRAVRGRLVRRHGPPRRAAARPHRRTPPSYVDDMVALIARLLDRDVAYATSDGVYLDVSTRRRLRPAGPRRARRPALGRSGRGQRGEAVAARLRPVEEGQAGRAVVAGALRRRPARAGTPSASS